MSDLDSTTPRVFLVRHGETEWTKNGRYTGTTDLPLTPYGIEQVAGTAALLVGPHKLVDVARVSSIWVSPRKRAQQTFKCLFDSEDPNVGISIDDEKVTITEDIAEWDYGDYEGLLVGEIRQKRKDEGLDQEREWDIWRDGCEGGESARQVTERLDRVIEKVQDLQRPYMNGEKPVDAVLVAHGLVLRCFMKRWLKLPLDAELPMIFSPGAISILGYKNHDVNQPAFFMGMALPAQK
ncbi:phosphoglycerate mutase [Amniculicola lignicola CBS 123094]|uniref:Phosphoglycerate mutase n=1 Tax=Amniculicola lignicola CBS 123094 TaxID=1392246 RepID=A0A6A5WG70_9PLEO|nr:phosphoglycerate mutase [Amniculicola lignicola CBS 123094]